MALLSYFFYDELLKICWRSKKKKKLGLMESTTTSERGDFFFSLFPLGRRYGRLMPYCFRPLFLLLLYFSVFLFLFCYFSQLQLDFLGLFLHSSSFFFFCLLLLLLFLSRRAEPEEMAPDSLTCGVCRKEFPLGEIVRFIQHKVLSCNKENYRVMCARSGRGGGPDGDGGHPLQIDGGGGSSGAASAATATTTGSVCSRRPSISAPINSRRLTPTVSSSSTPAGADDDMLAEGGAGQSGSAYPVKAEGEEDRAGAGKGPTTADAESNTVNSGKKKNTHIHLYSDTALSKKKKIPPTSRPN